MKNDTVYEEYYAPDRATWRTWLAENHATSPGIWLVYYKQQSGKPRVSYDDAVEEALCFGWIDSRPNAIDDERYKQLFSPRKPKSPWSRLNKERVTRLIAQGLMTDAGLAVIEAAKAAGLWESYDAIEELTVPPDLEAAFAEVPGASRRFAAFSNSDRKQMLWWVTSAKRPETRAQRIAKLVQAATDGVNPLAYRPRKTPLRIEEDERAGTTQDL